MAGARDRVVAARRLKGAQWRPRLTRPKLVAAWYDRAGAEIPVVLMRLDCLSAAVRWRGRAAAAPDFTRGAALSARVGVDPDGWAWG